jgi:hypothetical protein
MTEFDDDPIVREGQAGDGDPSRDPHLRRMLEQLPHDARTPSAEFVARARAEWHVALASRRQSTPTILTGRFRPIMLPMALAASIAATVYSLLRPLPGAITSDDPLLAASIGTMTHDSQRLWSGSEPFGFSVFNSGEVSNDE